MRDVTTPNGDLDMVDLEELAGRVEGLATPCGEIERRVMHALIASGDMAFAVAPARFRVTESLDMATSLVPDGWAISTGHSADGDERAYTTFLERTDWTDDEAETVSGSSDCWAASIVAACLRALAKTRARGEG